MKVVDRYYTLRLKSLCVNWNMVVSKIRDPSIDPKILESLLLGHPKGFP